MSQPPPLKPPSQGTLVKYGLTADEWLAMCAACGYTCVVCGKPFEDRRTQIYHVARYRVMAVGKSRLVPRLTLSW